ncbi:hypothetical protein DM793_13860 [Paenarthrobacter nitroguajacolicus]|uniref:hypothetical protein n=1 Tax=Paenarthrobacter nitroguajacolicus TaxID=211146 RepID=UPI0015BDAC70|nr:hypothetical protein [Paenarthrobacter nitroguajacolicus]NWL12359.1 hypothetical protein [Paenarthrobacter nitroguajacolicus]
MTITIEAGRYFHVTGKPPTEIEDSINTAVEMVLDHSMSKGWQGILVTRHGPDMYTVNLSAEVPYGVTVERDLTGSNQPHSVPETMSQ